MEKSMKCFALLLFFTQTIFADRLTLENNTSYRNLAIQWASSARIAQENNESLMQGDALSNLSHLRQIKETVAIPKNAMYFRILAWEKKGAQPDMLTNWVELVPGKTYQLKEEHLTPCLLMNGMGC
jgi:hypothetical protein